jgi:hypothetical protein
VGGPLASAQTTVVRVTSITGTISDVPPGTYYVRVKAANHIGDSVSSNEIVVTVRSPRP